MNSNDLNGLCLAYLGDSVLETLTRKKLLELGYCKVGLLNKQALKYVKASEQSKSLENILPILDENEMDYYKRGRNSDKIRAPKSATVTEYRRATGFEAIFGALFIDGNEKRINELFSIAYPELTFDNQSKGSDCQYETN